ncbi:MAG TPA: lysylphosphatidylglycerol synthase transmembrane domain-containing protein [Gemmatimonadales bacterium]|nr:lysylphosphatidylglycerol synthase transmembrane domain-containing protein [Gemmatimonadales bacterium]
MKLRAKVAVSVGLLTLLLVLLPWHQVTAALARLSAGVWAAVLGGFVVGHTVGVFKWRMIVNAARASLGVADAGLCYAAGLFANLCLPTIVGGDLLRMALAGRFTRRPEAALFGGILDRITDTTALGLLILGGGLAARHALPGWGGEALAVALAVAVALVGAFLPLVLRRPLARWPRRLRRRVGRALVALRRIGRTPGTALAALGLSFAIQSGFVVLNAWLGWMIGIEVPLAVWFLVWPLAKVAALLPISLGGLAVREASLAALLVPFGVPAAMGVVCSLLWQTVMIAGGLLGGLVWLLLAQRRSRLGGPSPAESLSAARYA